jgi:two-component system, cell cycle sensor histidine kinase and response regulator CckA
MNERMKVLVIEDLPTDAELAQREIAKALGACEFRRVETRPDFLDALETFRPALIVSDYQLPQFDGLTALKLALERCPDVPFIIVTGSMNEDTAVECMKAGAWDYVIKEHVKRLGPAVQGALDRQRTRLEARRAEHEREASETRYRRLFEAAKDGILILDAATGEIVDVNPFLLELTGHPREHFLGRHLWDIGLFNDIAASKDSFADLQARQYVRYEDLPLATRDGQHVDVEFVSNVYRVDGHSVIQCNIRDITERKLAEKRALEQHATLSALLESTDSSIFSVDCAYRYTTFNATHAAVMKAIYGADIQVGDSLARHQTVPEDWQRARKNLDRALQGEAFVESAFSGDESHSRRYFEISHYPIRTGASGIIGVSVFSRDITGRRRAEMARDALEDQLRASQKMEAIGSLAGGVAHDFNNLLSVILSYTGFAMEGLRDGDPLKSDLLEVTVAANRAVALTRQLLAFSRKQLLQPVPLDLNQIAAGLESMLRRILGEDIDYLQVLEPALGLTLADPSQIEQVLMNLVVNARDAMPDGGKLTIETSNVEIDEEYAARHVAVAPGSYVQLMVTDTGNGMDEATKARLFEPFFTTKEKGRGTGLGLSTVYGIVKQSRGNIWVYSEPGKGTTFKVYLPRELTATTAADINAAKVARQVTGTETILVVEDEDALRKVAKRSLEAAGYRVLAAANGDDALVVAAQHAGDIHLLLTDVVMPRMSGKALATELSKARSNLKVVYTSGYTDNAIVHHGVLDAGTHFLPKPFTSAEVARKVREILDMDPG